MWGILDQPQFIGDPIPVIRKFVELFLVALDQNKVDVEPVVLVQAVDESAELSGYRATWRGCVFFSPCGDPGGHPRCLSMDKVRLTCCSDMQVLESMRNRFRRQQTDAFRAAWDRTTFEYSQAAQDQQYLRLAAKIIDADE
jgi:hypothetical protein